MYTGNHDQVTLGGGVHALEPLRYAFEESQIMMISEPTITLGALWIPYRRSATVMRKVLSEATKRDDISMIFCHGKLLIYIQRICLYHAIHDTISYYNLAML